MPAIQWTRIQDLFLEASELPGAEREQLLERETGGDPELRRAVESLLLAADQTGGFLTRAMSNAAMMATQPKTPQPGDRFGAYEWKQTLGEGGMGSVFLAERVDGAYQKKVAIKVVRAAMDSPAARGRFRAERQILAQLEHANVARLLEGGETEDGLPYVVMEYIDGVPVDEYCRARELGIEERVALFRQVCAGVGYAHRNLVVHRDLKPANILVTADGIAKIVDFGIAKSIGDGHGFLTSAGDRALTPNYASPEQVLGKHITPASDVFSLGVVLFELLTGKVPFDLTGAIASRIEKVICEEDPQPPSAAGTELWGRAASRLRGDLDNIVAKAMRKDPAMRYESVEALSADLERYLLGFPVLAAPLSSGYRARKFLRRNRWPVVAAAVFAMAAVAFVVTVIRERNRANRERVKAEQVAKFLAESFRAASPQQAKGRVVTAKDILDTGAARIETELGGQPDVQATLMRTIGVVYSSIGEPKRGLVLVNKAVEARQRAAASRIGAIDPDELVRDAMSAAGVRFNAGDRTSATKSLEDALRLQERLAPRNMDLRGSLLSDLASAYRSQGGYAKGEQLMLQAVEAHKKAGDLVQLAETTGRLARSYTDLGNYDQAIPIQLETLAVLLRAHGEWHPSVASLYLALSRAHHETGRAKEGVQYAEKAAAVARKIYTPTDVNLTTVLSNLGLAYSQAGRYEDAFRVHEETLAIFRQEPKQKPELIAGLSNVAKAYMALGRHERNYQLTKEAIDAAREIGQVSPVLVNNWAVAQRRNAELEEALRGMQEAMAAVLKSLPADHVNVATYRLNLALVLLDLRRQQEAARAIEEAAAILKKRLPSGHWMFSYKDALLAEARLPNNIAEAGKLAESAAVALRKAKHETESAALRVLGRTYLLQGNAAKAVEVLTRAVSIERKPSGFHDQFSLAITEARLARALLKAGRAEEAALLLAHTKALLHKYPHHRWLRAAIAE